MKIESIYRLIDNEIANHITFKDGFPHSHPDHETIRNLYRFYYRLGKETKAEYLTFIGSGWYVFNYDIPLLAPDLDTELKFWMARNITDKHAYNPSLNIIAPFFIIDAEDISEGEGSAEFAQEVGKAIYNNRYIYFSEVDVDRLSERLEKAQLRNHISTEEFEQSGWGVTNAVYSSDSLPRLPYTRDTYQRIENRVGYWLEIPAYGENYFKPEYLAVLTFLYDDEIMNTYHFWSRTTLGTFHAINTVFAQHGFKKRLSMTDDQDFAVLV